MTDKIRKGDALWLATGWYGDLLVGTEMPVVAQFDEMDDGWVHISTGKTIKLVPTSSVTAR